MQRIVLEGLVAGLVVGLALLPLARAIGSWRPALRRPALMLPLLGYAAVVAIALRTPRPLEEAQIGYRPIEEVSESYASSDTCQSCHPRPYATWDASYHSTMTQLASPETVEAGDEFAFRYLHDYAWNQVGQEYRVRSTDPAWGPGGVTELPIVMATGSHHEQVYWMPTGSSRRLRVFPFVYRIGEDRWLPWSHAFLMPELGPDQVNANWNVGCAFCHSTDPRPKIFEDHHDTRVSDFGISCESCHGPAREHVLENRDPTRRYRLHRSDDGDPTITNPSDLSAARINDVCGSCHGVFTPLLDDLWSVSARGYDYHPGDELTATRNIVRVEGPRSPETQALLQEKPHYMESHFWSDGAAIVNGREYNAITRSKCSAGGQLSCLSCHQLHKEDDDPRSLSEWADDQLAPGMRGDGACLQCHADFAEAPTQHTRHEPASEGSRCQNCHMANTVYGMLKATRDHEIRSPSARETLETGRPNACNLCHLDQTLAWSAEHLERWYDQPAPEFGDPEHERTSQAVLSLLRGDAIQRVFIAWHMGWTPALEASGHGWIAPFLGQLLEDPYPAIRHVARNSLGALEGYEEVRLEPTSSPQERAAAKWRVREIWEGGRAGRRAAPRPEVLLNDAGILDPVRFGSLLSERDDRLVVIEE